jgi:hypothetical protein
VFNRDYNVDGMVFPNPFFGDSDVPYVDIPANQTFINVVMTPVDDALAEGNETAAFYIRGDASYEQGRPSGVTMTIVDNDAPPPSVAAVYVRGSAWKGGDDSDNVTFKEYLAARGLGDADYGFRLDNAPATVLPWTNVDQVVLRYTAPPTGSANPTAGGVVLQGTRSGYAIASAQALDPRTFLLTLDRPLGTQPSGDGNGDRLRLAVPGGAAGGPYELRFGVLPGDVDGSGQVLAADFSDVKRRFFKETNTPAAGAADYDAYHDVNGDGVILADDFSAVKKRFFDDLPPAAAAALGTGTPITNQLLRTPTKRTAYR